MKNRTINAVVILGILSLVTILMVQLLWMKKTIDIQETSIAIQAKEDSLNIKEFGQQVHVALRNVLEEINENTDGNLDLYGAVKQIRSNHFTVDINEELQPYYLETLLKKALYNQNIHQDFVYGIYDCFTDSIVFGNLIKFSKDSLYAPVSDSLIGITPETLNLKKDGHYFTVFFPNVKPIFNDDKDCCTNIGRPKPKVSPLILIFLFITTRICALLISNKLCCDTK